MKSTKLMLSGIMLMLIAIVFAIADLGRNSALSGAAIIIFLIALAVFIVGLILKG